MKSDQKKTLKEIDKLIIKCSNILEKYKIIFHNIINTEVYKHK